jgi:SHS2 domain-containing protein
MVQPDTRSYDYFDHDADVGIVVRGPTRTAAFEAAAEASFAVMGEPARIRPRRCIRVAFEETNAELGLAQSSARRGATPRSDARALRARAPGLELVGHGLGGAMATGPRAWGQVKGATLTMLAVRPMDEGGRPGVSWMPARHQHY